VTSDWKQEAARSARPVTSYRDKSIKTYGQPPDFFMEIIHFQILNVLLSLFKIFGYENLKNIIRNDHSAGSRRMQE